MWQFVLDPRTRGMLHHATLHDCQHVVPDRPLNQAFDCSTEGTKCNVVRTYVRNFTMPSWLMEKAGAGWPFGAGNSRYWVSSWNLSLPSPKKGAGHIRCTCLPRESSLIIIKQNARPSSNISHV